MGLETPTYISDLVATNPTDTDQKKEGDNHIRNIKAALLATFPNITGAMTVTHTELNVPKVHASSGSAANLTMTGTPVAPTAAAGTNTTQVATAEFVVTAILNAVMSSIFPGQTDKQGYAAVTDGSAVTWAIPSQSHISNYDAGIR